MYILLLTRPDLGFQTGGQLVLTGILGKMDGGSLIATEKNITITISNGENAAWISADINMMERVVQNLLTSAIKFTPENGKIHVDLISETGE